MRIILVAAASLGGLAACTTGYDDPPPSPTQGVGTATALLRDAAGRTVGTANASQTSGGIKISIEGTSLPSGPHGVHLHANGSCIPPDFTSAGAHWNPSGRQHGRQNPAGAHEGDLPNLLIGTDGRGSLEYLIPGADMSESEHPLLDADGTALVVHVSADDHRTDPSGNSGGRIACGLFEPA